MIYIGSKGAKTQRNRYCLQRRGILALFDLFKAGGAMKSGNNKRRRRVRSPRKNGNNKRRIIG